MGAHELPAEDARTSMADAALRKLHQRPKAMSLHSGLALRNVSDRVLWRAYRPERAGRGLQGVQQQRGALVQAAR